MLSNLVIVLVLLAISCVAMVGIPLINASKTNSEVYYHGNQNSNKVTLMINVYWGTEYLDEMLQVLDDNNVKTTFFVGGTWAVKESDMLQKIHDAGHEIANHGYYHKNHGEISAEKNREEIVNTHNLVKSLIGVDMNLFAPPSGSFNNQTVEIAKSLGYKTIMWTRDTIDWKYKTDTERIYQKALKNCKGGDLVLMHPTQGTKDALDRIIKDIKSRGFELCTVSENLGI